uniref:Uncharacterized protein n=1 Tax=Zea mays TaxID=4577 RepID=A0A804NI90_MAIZE
MLPWMAGAADFASIPLGPLRAQPVACPRMADLPPPPPTSTRQHPILARSAMPSLGPLRARTNHCSPRPLHRSPSPRSSLQIRSPRPQRLASAALPLSRDLRDRNRRAPPPSSKTASSLLGVTFPPSHFLFFHSGVLVKQRRWLGLLLVFLHGCVQGFSKSLAMTVLSEIRDKTFFVVVVRLLPPSPSRHVACSSSCPFACLPCLSLRAPLSRVTA